MKKLWILVCALAILPVSAFASQKSKSIDLDQKAQIAGKQLKPGNYKLKWDDSTTNAKTNVTFSHNGDVVATVPARIVHQKDTTNAEFEFNDSNGVKKLDRVYFNKEVLEFGNQMSQKGS